MRSLWKRNLTKHIWRQRSAALGQRNESVIKWGLTQGQLVAHYLKTSHNSFLEQVTLSWPASCHAERHLNGSHGRSPSWSQLRWRQLFSRFNGQGECPSERAGKIIRRARRQPRAAKRA